MNHFPISIPEKNLLRTFFLAAITFALKKKKDFSFFNNKKKKLIRSS